MLPLQRVPQRALIRLRPTRHSRSSRSRRSLTQPSYPEQVSSAKPKCRSRPPFRASPRWHTQAQGVPQDGRSGHARPCGRASMTVRAVCALHSSVDDTFCTEYCSVPVTRASPSVVGRREISSLCASPGALECTSIHEPSWAACGRGLWRRSPACPVSARATRSPDDLARVSAALRFADARSRWPRQSIDRSTQPRLSASCT